MAVEHKIRKDPIIEESGEEISDEENPTLQMIGRTESNVIHAKHRKESASDRRDEAEEVDKIDFGGSANGVNKKNDGDRVVALVFVHVELELDLHRWLSLKQTRERT